MANKKKKKYNPIAYVKTKTPGKYTSEYADQLAAARSDLMNYKYDPLQDANFQSLAQIYGARGNIAAKDTLADAASLNGGLQTSYAVSAAQQARNQYNQELMALIPDLEANAYNRMQNNYSLLMDADETAYNRYRDQIADWQWGKGYDTDIYQYRQSLKKSSGGGGGGRRSSGGGSYSPSTTTSGRMPITKEDYDNILNKNKKKTPTATGGSGKRVAMTK